MQRRGGGGGGGGGAGRGGGRGGGRRRRRGRRRRERRMEEVPLPQEEKKRREEGELSLVRRLFPNPPLFGIESTVPHGSSPVYEVANTCTWYPRTSHCVLLCVCGWKPFRISQKKQIQLNN